MKKILLFIFLLFIPFMVKAQDVVIKEVTLVDSTEGMEAEEHPEFENLKINFNLKFSKLGDFVKYKVVLENTSDKAYELENMTKFNEGEYVKYEMIYEGSEIIRAHRTEEFFIVVTYNKFVKEFENGKYVEKNAMSIDLKDGESSSTEQNPYTSTLPYALIVIEVIALVVFIIAFKKKKALLAILIATFLVPFTIYALDKIRIEIETNIEIYPKDSTFELYINNCGHIINHYSFEYIEGQTWQDFLDSEKYEEASTQFNETNYIEYSFYHMNMTIYNPQEECTDIDYSVGTNLNEMTEEEWEHKRYCEDKYKNEVEKEDLIINGDNIKYFADYCPKQ